MKDLGKVQGRLLVFGGPYSNLAATLALQLEAQRLEIPAQNIICTGDIVAYCAEPQQTAELIRDWGIQAVMGNCEESLGFEQDDCGCGFDPGSSCSVLAISWYRYASQRVSTEIRSWMRALPRRLDFRLNDHSFRVLHGSLHSINEFVFPSTSLDAKRAQLDEAAVDVIIGGHSGLPFGQKIDRKLWLNAGVIGMPANDGSADGWYMLIDSDHEGIAVSWHRLAYDAALSQASTRAAGMTEYAEALLTGLWPSMDILPPAEQQLRQQRIELAALRLG